MSAGLPKLKLVLSRLVNPNFVPQYGADGKATNMDEYHVDAEVEVEVLTVHFQKGTMRIRVPAPYATTRDVDAAPFFEQFAITAK